MTESLFPITPLRSEKTDTVFVLEPYWDDGAWVFDDPAVGLRREPFVAGVTEMIDRLAAGVPDAARVSVTACGPSGRGLSDGAHLGPW